MSMLGEKSIIKDQSLLKYEAIKSQITILAELRELIPPLLTEETRQLEQNILNEGCREALMIWETTQQQISEGDDSSAVYVLIDGHNRYAICQQYDIDFKIHLVSYPSIKEVREFMIDNQLGRRNLIAEQAAYLRGLRYNNEKQEKGKYSRDDHKGQNVLYDMDTKKESTSQRLAKQYNVSEKTIKRDAEFAEGIGMLAPELKKDILGGKVKVKKVDIQQLSQLETVAQPIQSIAEVNLLIAASNVVTQQKTLKQSTELALLKTKIKATIDQITAQNANSLMAELEQLLNELKNGLSVS